MVSCRSRSMFLSTIVVFLITYVYAMVFNYCCTDTNLFFPRASYQYWTDERRQSFIVLNRCRLLSCVDRRVAFGEWSVMWINNYMQKEYDAVHAFPSLTHFSSKPMYFELKNSKIRTYVHLLWYLHFCGLLFLFLYFSLCLCVLLSNLALILYFVVLWFTNFNCRTSAHSLLWLDSIPTRFDGIKILMIFFMRQILCGCNGTRKLMVIVFCLHYGFYETRRNEYSHSSY